MTPKKIAVMYDCGTDLMRGFETRISITYETQKNAVGEACKHISAFALDPHRKTVSLVRLELTDEVVKEILEILQKQ